MNEQWELNLKPGDQVLYSDDTHMTPNKIGTVLKVTPTGIVKLENGLAFKRTKYSGTHIYGYGNKGYGYGGRNYGELFPSTPEFIEEFHKQQMLAEQLKRIKRNIIEVFQFITYFISWNDGFKNWEMNSPQLKALSFFIAELRDCIRQFNEEYPEKADLIFSPSNKESEILKGGQNLDEGGNF